MATSHPAATVLLVAATIAFSDGSTATQRPSQDPVFRAGTHVVSRDVTVRDGRGRFVGDLRREDFRVFEDGVEQKIESFALVSGGRIRDAYTPPRRPEQGLILPERAASGEGSRIIIVFIDDLHIQARHSIVAQNILKLFRDEVLRNDDQIAIVSSGYSSIELNLRPFPGDERFIAEVRKLLGSGATATELLGMPDGAEGPVEVRFRVHVAFKTAYRILEQLEKITDRRKAFVYVSSGYDFDPFPEARSKAARERLGLKDVPETTGDVFNKPGQIFSEADLLAQLAELGRAANRANTRFYPVDPRGLVAGADIDSPVSFNDARANLTATTESLRTLADLTGGLAAVHTNDFRGFFRKIDQDLSDYYILRYTSTNSDPLKRTRRVTIEVSRPGMALQYPDTYAVRSR